MGVKIDGRKKKKQRQTNKMCMQLGTVHRDVNGIKIVGIIIYIWCTLHTHTHTAKEMKWNELSSISHMALKSIECYVNTKLKQLLGIMAKCELQRTTATTRDRSERDEKKFKARRKSKLNRKLQNKWKSIWKRMIILNAYVPMMALLYNTSVIVLCTDSHCATHQKKHGTQSQL